jgi:hypothetical protein
LHKKEEFKSTSEDLNLISGMVIHAADICGPVKTWDLQMKWGRLVTQEFTEQAAAEKKLGVKF